MTLLSSMSPLRRRLLRLRFVTLLKAADPCAVDPGAFAVVATAIVSFVSRFDGVCSTSTLPLPVLLQGEEDGDDLSVPHW